MTVTDLLDEKYRLSSAISELVDKFYDSTGITVEAIDLVGENTVMDPKTKYIITRTAIKVRLGL